MKGDANDLRIFRSVVDAFEAADITTSKTAMLGVLAMMLDGLDLFHGISHEMAIALARVHAEKIASERKGPPS
jgi:hypothetical protein